MILQRYIGLSVGKGWMLVIVVLGAIFGLISFTQELEHAEAPYNTLAVARYTLLILPNQLVSLAPVIALLGTIVALSSLDRFNELTIVSCAGFSPTQLLGTLALPTVLLMAGLWICMEYVTPQLQQAAGQERQRLRHGSAGWLPDGGVWSTDGQQLHPSDESCPRTTCRAASASLNSMSPISWFAPCERTQQSSKTIEHGYFKPLQKKH